MSKFIFVVGGVYSGTGKGIATASIGLLLKLRSFKIQILKLDPYLNINAGIIRPSDHGECYVCSDGSEVDLDLGSYERIAGIETSSKNICTSGTLYKEIISEQEDGKWLGSTIQIVPHVTDKIIERLNDLGKENDVVLVEIGGTVGDIESSPFYEALCQYKQKKGDDVMIVMVAPILWVDTIKEFKTKPLQNSIKDLQRFGLQPDILLCRCTTSPPEQILDKLSSITNIPRSNILDAPDTNSIYHIPLELYDRQVDDLIVDKFRLKRNACRIRKYKDLVQKNSDNIKLDIGVFCKYDSPEAYISLKEALDHAALNENVKININWINSELIEKEPSLLKNIKIDAAIVPGGFDNRGVEGKITAIKYVRENKIPFLGICLGLQCAVIEFARNICKIEDANSTEFDKNTKNPVICYVEGQKDLIKKCSTMRLGSYDCELNKNSIAFELYGKKNIVERHRHRYEVNNKYVDLYNKNKFYVSGTNSTGLIEIMELDKKIHPFFVCTQAHPEFKSKLIDPSPLFIGLVKSALRIKTNAHGK